MTISEPVDQEMIRARALQFRDWFRRGMIGETTYRLSLRIIGFRDQDLESEINLARMK